VSTCRHFMFFMRVKIKEKVQNTGHQPKFASKIRQLIFIFILFGFITFWSQSTKAQNQNIYIRINQIGFNANSPKSAVVLGNKQLPEKFEILNAQSGKIVFEGQAKKLSSGWGNFDQLVELDFSNLTNQGRFLIRYDGADSQVFQISSAAYAELPDQLLEFMRQQRCGYNPWLDAVCHSFDGRLVDGPVPDGSYLDATGGWHDAGDQLKYLLTSSNATAQMLLAYRLHEQTTAGKRNKKGILFKDKVNELGQNGSNNIPDILDEARWGLNWMLKLHPSPEELYHQVADDRDHIGFRLPQNETANYGWGTGSYRVVYFATGKPQGLRQFKSESNGLANLAGRYAAAMALGYQIWKDDPVQSDYALKLLRAGREVYALGKKKEGVQQGNSYGAPYRYEETTWADDMEWGAAELFMATGERKYLEDAKRYARLAATDNWMSEGKAKHYQFYPFMNLGHFRLYNLVDKKIKKELTTYYKEGIDQTLKRSHSNPFSIGVPFIWCSNNLVVALATQLVLYERMTSNSLYQSFSAKQKDWLLGRNPWGFSMFTEIPENGVYPRNPHLFATAILKRGIRGGLVDGPVYQSIFQSLKGVGISEPDPLAPFHDRQAVFHDDIKDYSTNEPTMDGTASAILLWALTAHDNQN
jgi:endoglucanase